MDRKSFGKLLPGSVSMQAKITLISVTVGITLLGFVARLLRRRKRARPKSTEKSLTKGKNQGASANGEILPARGAPNLGLYRHHRQGSICSDRQSIHSLLTANLGSHEAGASAVLSPQQLGTMGMEALETGIAYWEDALAAYRPPPGDLLALTDAEDGKFTHVLEKILEKAYRLQESCSQLFLDSNSVLFKSETQSIVSSRHEKMTEPERRGIRSMSSIESFVSAQAEIADLEDFAEYELNVDIKELPLYQTALKKNEEGAIPIRLLRTEMLRCQSNKEYISKVHCIRVAFQLLFQREEIRSYFMKIGNKILTGLMLCGEKDPKDCLLAYEDIIAFCNEKNNWAQMEEELLSRGVKCLSFYDVVLDFIVLDAFEDLESPPSSVMAVVQNRWLSNGFKETALATAVWSVLKAKKRMLKHSDGFISRFYIISEHLIPVLAWGFYGPDEKLKEICIHFKEEMMGFMLDIFNFNKVHFTKIEELAADIMQLANLRFDRTLQKLRM